MRCSHCKRLLSESEPRVVLSDETQRILWADGAVPEVDIRDAAALGYYCSLEAGRDAVEAMLRLCGAQPTWSGVRPTEECAQCGADIQTSEWHRVLTLLTESGPEDAPDPATDVEHAARFCLGCNPVSMGAADAE